MQKEWIGLEWNEKLARVWGLDYKATKLHRERVEHFLLQTRDYETNEEGIKNMRI